MFCKSGPRTVNYDKAIGEIRPCPGPVIHLMSHFGHTPFSCHQCSAIMCMHDVIHKTGSTYRIATDWAAATDNKQRKTTKNWWSLFMWFVRYARGQTQTDGHARHNTRSPAIWASRNAVSGDHRFQCSASEVTTLRRYTNPFIIIIVDEQTSWKQHYMLINLCLKNKCHWKSGVHTF